MRLRANRVIAFLLDETVYRKCPALPRSFAPKRTGELAEKFTNRHGSIAYTRIDPLADSYRQHLPQIELRPDVAQLLETIEPDSLLAVVADGPLGLQQSKCQAIQLSNYVDRVVYPDFWGRSFWAPHPRSLLSIQNCYNFHTDQCTFLVGKDTRGLQMAQRAGWRTIRIRQSAQSYNSERHITSIPALIDSLYADAA